MSGKRTKSRSAPALANASTNTRGSGTQARKPKARTATLSAPVLDWTKLFSERRLSHLFGQERSPEVVGDPRLGVEKDFDRILFSTPVRRLADKTQVWPTEQQDSVHTRLTHSYEASNLARSIGVRLARTPDWIAEPTRAMVVERLPSLLGAAALAHDLGNPPFGHKGEDVIQQWFGRHEEVFDTTITTEQRQEFETFDGNAQTVRILASLQGLPDGFGLNLTSATLGSLLKYTVPARGVRKKGAGENSANKKPGYFSSEEEAINLVFKELGLTPGIRHPLVYIVEACDDIAYSVMDVEDAVRKGVVGFHDMIAFLDEHGCDDTRRLAASAKKEFWTQSKAYSLSLEQASDYAVQKFRTDAVGVLVVEATATFIASLPGLMTGEVQTPLLDRGASQLANCLKKFGYQCIYGQRAIQEKETQAAYAVNKLLDYFWDSILNRKSTKRTFFQNYAFNALSENYRKMLDSARTAKLPLRYRELRLLCDMVAGMTDTYCLKTFEHLARMHGEVPW